MKTECLSFRRLLILIFSIVVFISTIYTFSYNFVYESINIVTTKATVVEYGSANNDVKKFVDKVNGEIVSVKNELHTDVVGTQEIVFVVAKGNVSKEIPIEVEVKDTVSPTINLVSDIITIKQGNQIDVFENIQSVVDSVDGSIGYVEKALDNGAYYTISSNVNRNVVGSYSVLVHAVDRNGNISDKDFSVIVEENPISKQVVSMAYSQLGKPYIFGAHGPYAFDCSGLIQYLYAQAGVGVSRGSSTQLYDGISVNYDEILPGDIISWGYGDGYATHSSLYVGNGKMIHAANPSQGVIISDVVSWVNGSGTDIIGVRRVS